MRVVVDTNVIMSGLFFGGVPGEILDAWHNGEIGLVASPRILAEYSRVAEALNAEFDEVDAGPFLRLLALTAEIVDAPELDEHVSRDRDDDNFLACALAARVSVVVSGDADLRAVSCWAGIEVLSPRQFRDRYLK